VSASFYAEPFSKVCAEYPGLSRYHDAWPVYDMIKMHLHYTSGQKNPKRKRSQKKQPDRVAKGKARDAASQRREADSDDDGYDSCGSRGV